MSRDWESLQRPGRSPGRLVAMGAAGLVTMLTVAGLVGIGPGAASAQMGPSRPSAAASDVSQDQAGSTSPSDPSTGKNVDDNWLTINDDPPADPSTRSSTSLPKGTGRGKRIVYDISDQRVWLVDANGDVDRTYLVSGGRNPDLLDPGTYNVYSMSRDAVSYNHKETMQYMVRFASGNHAPIGFHDIPARADKTLVQARDELGTPLSSGCIRQWIRDARALYEFAAIDTAVVVTA